MHGLANEKFPFLLMYHKRNEFRLKTKANSEHWSTPHDVDALITVEVLLVRPEHADGECLQIANIQFNNLDIIGKYHTIYILIFRFIFKMNSFS